MTADSTGRKPLATLRDYELLSRLGQGGMGTVYLARQTHLDKRVAIKLLPRQHTSNPEMVARFKREMKAVGRLHHPNIIQALDAGELKGVHYLVLEYAEGLDLGTLVQRSGPLPIADACEIIRQAAVGLEHAHRQGLVHRDIKPSNLMICRMDALVRPSLPRGTSQATSMRSDEGVQPTVKILDLGLALLNSDREAVSEGLTGSQQIMGTVDYMAPEQTSNTHQVDIRADIYSLGCTLYALLSGQAPFAHESQPWQKLAAHNNTSPKSIRKSRPEVPPEVAAILDKMLAKRPEQRYATPLEVAAALEPHCRHNVLVSTLVNAEALQAQHQARANAATQSLHQSALQGTTGAGNDAQRGSHDPVDVDDELLELIRAASLPEKTAQVLEPTQQLVRVVTTPGAREVTKRFRHESRNWWRQVAAMIGCGVLGILFVAVVLWIRTNVGYVKLTLYHPDAQVTIDGDTIRLRPGADDDEYLLRVSPGEHQLRIEKDGYVTFSRDLEIAKGEEKLVGVQLLRVDAAPPVGWTPRPSVEPPIPNQARTDEASILPKSNAASPAREVAERTDEGVEPTDPPPLDEWLQGRKLLTVKQDGSAMFTKIQDALNALKPGEVVEVLDKGPYRERLTVDNNTNRATPEDTGLISRVETVVQVSAWQPISKEQGADNAIQLAGHMLFNSGSFRLAGFTFSSPPELGARELYLTVTDTVIEDCHFPSQVPSDGAKLYRSIQTGFWLGKSQSSRLVIRNCAFAGLVHIGSYSPVTGPESTITLTQNAFQWASGDGVQFTNVSKSPTRVDCSCNVFTASHGMAMSAVSRDAPTETYFANNTVTSGRLFFLNLTADGILDLEARRNLCPSNLLRSHDQTIDLRDREGQFRFNENAFPAFPTDDFGVISREKNIIGPIEFLSTDPRDTRNYLRLKPDSPLANLPPDADGRTYVGALPPGPAPAEGDWFTRLLDRWHAAQSSP